MYTRNQYMEGRCSFFTYYRQFVTPTIEKFVVDVIGANKILQANDISLNDIPLYKWDAMHDNILNLTKEARKDLNEDNSLSASVCIAKNAALMFKEKSSVLC